MSAIYDGQLEVGWRQSRRSRLPRLTQHLMIPRARLEELRRLRVPLSDVESRALTLGEVADIMNVPVDVVRQIFGLPVEQYPECEFDAQSVLKAAARFISVREITIRTGIKPLRFPGIARKRSVPRITKGVYCRASAERMIPLLKRSSD